MSAAWIVVLVVGAATVCFKAAGPVVLGRRELPAQALAVVQLLAPVMLAALVAMQTLGGGGRQLVLDARLVGIGAAGLALWRGLSLLPVIVVAAAAAALTRLLF